MCSWFAKPGHVNKLQATEELKKKALEKAEFESAISTEDVDAVMCTAQSLRMRCHHTYVSYHFRGAAAPRHILFSVGCRHYTTSPIFVMASLVLIQVGKEEALASPSPLEM